MARAGGRCEVCGEPIARVAFSVHHRKPRRMGGTKDPAINSPANLMLVCGSGTTGCHGTIESRRTWAIESGYIVSAMRDPAEAPILLRGHAWRNLTDDGRYAVPNPG